VRGNEKRTTAGGGAVRRLFRQAAKVLSQLAPGRAPKKSSRRGGDTSQQFRRTAQKIMRSRARPAAACGTAVLWLADALDWLDLWHHTAPGAELSDEQQAEPNHLSPHP
jgi:hypothetical protein